MIVAPKGMVPTDYSPYNARGLNDYLGHESKLLYASAGLCVAAAVVFVAGF